MKNEQTQRPTLAEIPEPRLGPLLIAHTLASLPPCTVSALSKHPICLPPAPRLRDSAPELDALFSPPAHHQSSLLTKHPQGVFCAAGLFQAPEHMCVLPGSTQDGAPAGTSRPYWSHPLQTGTRPLPPAWQHPQEDSRISYLLCSFPQCPALQGLLQIVLRLVNQQVGGLTLSRPKGVQKVKTTGRV